MWYCTKKLCTRCDAWVAHSHDEAASHQLPIAAAFWVIWIVSTEKCSSLMQNLMHIHCYSLSHFECDSHTVYMLTQWLLQPPLTSTVESSLFTHVHSSPHSLDARLHRCCTNHSHYINNSWTFLDRPRIFKPINIESKHLTYAQPNGVNTEHMVPALGHKIW